MVTTRVLTPDDWPEWRALRLAALAESPHAFRSRLSEWQGEGDREERWRARLAVPGSHNLVALVDGRPAGIASGFPGEEPTAAELHSVWVSPDARGRGVGARLIGSVERWALRARRVTLKLTVMPGNTHAIALYLRHGFFPTGEHGVLLPDGIGREIVMAKALARG